MRSLGPEEQALWARVAATIRPLSREPLKATKASSQVEPIRQNRRPKGPPPPAPRAAPSRAPAVGTLDSSWDRLLRSGAIQPDRVLDLHGHNLDQAWKAIDRGLERAIATGQRVVLLVTGHERPADPPIQRGKIRAAVNDWLSASRHASEIAAVRAAHRRHGGGGSLYIILRRNRPRSTLS
jgi:DNA-nicking Smr family endonuclease